jgi:hypothetical protein
MKKTNWEKEWNELFTQIINLYPLKDGICGVYIKQGEVTWKDIEEYIGKRNVVLRQFISNLLTQQKQEIIKEIENAPEKCNICVGTDKKLYGECKCSYELTGLISRNDLITKINKLYE